ncbi:hypothetical protein U1Q18_037354 [Sarracenia purpurea var. burkii]
MQTATMQWRLLLGVFRVSVVGDVGLSASSWSFARPAVGGVGLSGSVWRHDPAEDLCFDVGECVAAGCVLGGCCLKFGSAVLGWLGFKMGVGRLGDCSWEVAVSAVIYIPGCSFVDSANTSSKIASLYGGYQKGTVGFCLP